MGHILLVLLLYHISIFVIVRSFIVLLPSSSSRYLNSNLFRSVSLRAPVAIVAVSASVYTYTQSRKMPIPVPRPSRFPACCLSPSSYPWPLTELSQS